MPFYIYTCETCGREKEVMHSMSECDFPSATTLKEITCHKKVMKRVPQVPQLMGMMGGSSKSEAELRADKQKKRKLRSKLHFKNEGVHEIKDPWSKKYFERKIKTDPLYKELKGDHEKLK